MATEAEIQRGIVKFLRTVGCAVWVTSQGYRKEPGGTRMTPGLPDLYVLAWPLKPGRFTGLPSWTWAEVKTPKGKLSLAQQEFRDLNTRAGIPWELWRSVDDAVRWARDVGIVE